MTTLYVTEPGSQLIARGETFQIFYRDKRLMAVPVADCERIVLFGNCRMNRQGERLARVRRIPVLLLDSRGLLLGRSDCRDGQSAKYSALARSRFADKEFLKITAESIVRAKLHNERILLRNYSRFYFSGAVSSAIEAIALLAEDLPNARTVEQLRDRAATASNFYWQAIAELLPVGLHCNGRKNPLELWLNLGRTLLREAIYSKAIAAGLDPHWGILHLKDEGGRHVLSEVEGRKDELSSLPLSSFLPHPSHGLPLVSDFAAELTPLFADAVAIKMLFLGSAYPTIAANNGSSVSRKSAIEIFIANWEKHLRAPFGGRCARSQIVHPSAGTVTYRQCLELQMREYVACLLGDDDCYRPLLATEDIAPTKAPTSGLATAKLFALV